MQTFSLEGKTVLVTGASSGIGRATAIQCAAAGARCILAARNADRLAETLASCGGAPHTVEQIDLADDAALASFIDRLPSLDGLVHCAGIGDNQKPLKFLSPQFVDLILSINLRAPILLLSCLAKQKKLNASASIVMISSIASFHPAPAHSIYAAAKGGLSAFVKGAAQDLAPRKIRVNSIAPGMVETPLIDFSALTREQRLADELRYPLKRYGQPSDIAPLAVYLLSDASSWMTGSQIVIDGGLTIGS
ncbi:MAG: SDR family oxidoreductase [Kiritimatiellae bacterium]|nr:SDR family oxidoreductase [Kiritimatiellia bacterium]